jgi:2-haloalkanoic acid dehalogenase type II
MTGMHFRAITFDCYGTLIDWDTGVAVALGPWAEQAGLAADLDNFIGDFDLDNFIGDFADAQCRHEAMRPFKSYRTVLHDAFMDTARAHGCEPAAEDASAFAASVGEWPEFPDTVAALARLRENHLLGVVSNVDDASFARTHQRLGGLIDEIVTADMVMSYKPALAHFERMIEILGARGIAKQGILHVAQSRFHDIGPAGRLGVATLWVDRHVGKPGRGINMPSDAEPDYRVENMAQAAALVAELRG